MAGISTQLESFSLIALDSNCFIYLVEGSPWESTVKAVFQAIEEDKVRAVTSTLSLTEALVKPLRNQQLALAKRYSSLLSHFPHLQLIPLQANVAERAASIRAAHSSVRTPDAIHLATALESGAQALVTNDRRLPQGIIPLMVLEDWTA